MPVYELETPKGTFELEVPEGTSQDDLDSYVNQALSDIEVMQSQEPQGAPEPTDPLSNMQQSALQFVGMGPAMPRLPEMEAQATQQALPEALGYAGETALNLPSSAVRELTGVAKALTVDLPQTAEGLFGLTMGAAQKAGDAMGFDIGEQYEPYVDKLVDFYANNYGENIGEYVKTEPAAVLGDLLLLVSGGASALAKGSKLAGKMSAAQKLEDVARGAARIDPVNLGIEGAGKGLSKVGEKILPTQAVDEVSEVATATGAGAASGPAIQKRGIVERGAPKGFMKTEAKAAAGDVKSQEALATEAAPDLELVKAAKDEGVLEFLDPDHISTNQVFIETQQLAKSQPGSVGRRDEIENLTQVGEAGKNILKEFGGTEDMSLVNKNIKANLENTIESIKQKESDLFDELREEIPTETRGDTPNLKRYFDERLDKLDGDVDLLQPIEKKVYKGLGLGKVDDAVEGENVFYHGSPSRIQGNIRGRTKWVTPEKSYAEEYKGPKGEGEVVAFSMDIKNPIEIRNARQEVTEREILTRIVNENPDLVKSLDAENKSKLRNFIKEAGTEKTPVFEIWDNSQNFVDFLKFMGYDGIKSFDDGVEILGALDASQMKRIGEGEPQKYSKIDELRKEAGVLAGKGQAFGDPQTGVAKQLYGAMAEDLGLIADELGLGIKRSLANQYTKQRKALEGDMMALFGNKLNKSLVGDLNNAATQLAKGDVQKLNNMLQAIPKGMRKEFMASALFKSFGKSTKLGELNFNTFVRWYEGLNKNSEAANLVFANLPKGAKQRMDNLYKISKGVNRAVQERIYSGKALTTELQNIEGMMSKMLQAGKKGAIFLPAEFVFPSSGILAGVGAATQSLMTKGKSATDRLDDIQRTINTPEFRDLMIKRAKSPEKAKEAYFRLASSKAFKRLAKAMDLSPDAKVNALWIENALKAPAKAQPEEETK